MITTRDFAIAAHAQPASTPDPPRFYCGEADSAGLAAGFSPLVPGQRVTLDPEQSRHALRVLRLSEHDRVRLLDGRGAEADAVIVGTAGHRATCQVSAVRRLEPLTPRITLATAIPKGPRGDAMMNDLAQLGADVVVPLRTARSVVDPRSTKLDKYQRAAAEAAKQCGRAWLMEVQPTMDFAQALSLGADLRLIADPGGSPTREVGDRVKPVGSVLVLIGPEGGFSAEESALAVDAGVQPWCFNANILRIETAAAAALAILRSLT